METLLVVAQHRSQYSNRVKPHGPGRFGSSQPGNFRKINCRTFQSCVGILPTPLKACSTPVTKRSPSSSSSSPVTPSPCTTSHFNGKAHLETAKSTPITINIKAKERSVNEELFDDNLSFSERWAGPAYSNSPPPSSLPIPKFSIRPKRADSLELPVSYSDIDIEVHPIAKSAPASPAREHSVSPRDLFNSVDYATKTLRRILNLNTEI